MSLQIYNTRTRQVETFKPLQEGKVTMYVCGPTVYDFLHIGNFRGAIFFNFVRQWLQKLGYEVKYVYNYTDIDDKIIKRAQEEHVSCKELSEKYIQEFEADFQAFGLQSHDSNPKATEYIQNMIDVIETLVNEGKAYVEDGEVLYSIDSFPSYGKLSGKKLDELEAGARVEVDQKKKNPLDFVLWKPSKEGEPHWESPWGKGRPGWHIECTCMILKELGNQIDIHGGGIDLIFPHHENEIAQGEGVTGESYVQYWMHNNFIKFGDDKMSKSLGNVVTARAFNEKYHPEILKFMYLSVHYRSLLSFSDHQIHQSIASLARIYTAMRVAEDIAGNASADASPEEFITLLSQSDEKIEKAINDDFNTSILFAKLFDVVRHFNAAYKPGQKIKGEHRSLAKAMLDWIRKYGELLALFLENPNDFLKSLDEILICERELDRAQIDQLVTDRTNARKDKDFKRADEIRDELTTMGVLVLDTPEGTTWELQKVMDDAR